VAPAARRNPDPWICGAAAAPAPSASGHPGARAKFFPSFHLNHPPACGQLGHDVIRRLSAVCLSNPAGSRIAAAIMGRAISLASAPKNRIQIRRMNAASTVAPGHARFSVNSMSSRCCLFFRYRGIFLVPWTFVYREFLAHGVPILPPILFSWAARARPRYEMKKGALDWENRFTPGWIPCMRIEKFITRHRIIDLAAATEGALASCWRSRPAFPDLNRDVLCAGCCSARTR